jgi:iron-sulfur cluster assembly protein
VLDFSDGLNGKGFHFNNPNASRTCSCGESFAV